MDSEVIGDRVKSPNILLCELTLPFPNQFSVKQFIPS